MDKDYFHEFYGFGDCKPEAILILKKTISILNEFEIDHFLISGTLLGYIRHNDFIPWDDDIDILVDESILDKLVQIVDKYPEINLFFKYKYDSIKICFSNGERIIENKTTIDWENCSVRNGQNNYCWPFVDMFIYQTSGAHICDGKKNNGFPFSCYRFIEKDKMDFFHRRWRINEFFPSKQVNFLGIRVNIPKNPDYFLRLNYGLDYMKKITSSSRAHKIESSIIGTITTDINIIK